MNKPAFLIFLLIVGIAGLAWYLTRDKLIGYDPSKKLNYEALGFLTEEQRGELTEEWLGGSA